MIELGVNIDHLAKVTSSCRHCGCKVDLNPNPVMNKIAMATERCTACKWPQNNEGG